MRNIKEIENKINYLIQKESYLGIGGDAFEIISVIENNEDVESNILNSIHNSCSKIRDVKKIKIKNKNNGTFLLLANHIYNH